MKILIADALVQTLEIKLRHIGCNVQKNPSLKEVINVAYQSPQSLESKLVKLKNTGGLGQTKDLKTTEEDENNLEYIQDNENKQKIINIKNDKY